MTLRQIANNDDDGDENNDDIDDDDAQRECAHVTDQSRSRPLIDFAYPCLLLAGNSGPGLGAMKTSSSVNLKQDFTSLFSIFTAQPESLPAPASARLELEAGVAPSQLAEPNDCHQGLLLVGGGLGPRGAGGGAWGAWSWWWGGAGPPLPAMLTQVGRLAHNPHIPSLIA